MSFSASLSFAFTYPQSIFEFVCAFIYPPYLIIHVAFFSLLGLSGQLQNKKMIEIGGHVIPLKRTDLIPNMPTEKDKEKEREKEREKHRAVPRMSFKGSRMDGETEGEGDADCAASKCGFVNHSISFDFISFNLIQSYDGESSLI